MINQIQAIYDTSDFVKTVSMRRYGKDLKSFKSTPWDSGKRTIEVKFRQTIAITNHLLTSKTVSTRSSSVPGQYYIIDDVSNQSGMMYTDCYTIRNCLRLSRLALTNPAATVGTTRIQIVSHVEFHKQFLLKNFIESEAYKGMNQSYLIYQNLAKSLAKDKKEEDNEEPVQDKVGR